MNDTLTRWSKLAGIAVLAVLMALSAFAESRHRTTTHGENDRAQRSTRTRGDGPRRAVPRSQPRMRQTPERERVESRSRRNRDAVGRMDMRRDDVRGDSHQFLRRERWPRDFDRGRSASRMVWLDHRAPFSVATRRGRLVTGSGTITRIAPYRDGYRFWLDGGRYSWYVPRHRWNEFPFRVGLFVRLGGYYGPSGYVDVYDIGGEPGYAPVYSSGLLHGVVERVDYWNDSIVILDDVSGRFIRVSMNVDPRLHDVHPGDWVEISGAWLGGSYFRPARLDTLRIGLGLDIRF